MSKRAKEEKRRKQFKKIIQEIRADPEKGLRRFYETYGEIINTTAYVVCGSTDKVNEVINDVLIKIWKRSEKIEDITNPEGWIYVITLNTAKDTLRERKLFPLNENILANDNEIQEIIDEHSFYWMINDLSEIEQAVMIQKFVMVYTFQEIAEELAKPLTTIMSIYYRALGKIKQKIEEKNKNN